MTGDPTADSPMAGVVRDGRRVGLRYRRSLRHPPEKVWRALTESEHLRHWLPCDIVGERRAGAEIALRFWPDHVDAYGIEDPVLHGRISVWDPPRVFEWTWGEDVLRFELEAAGADGTDGTDLTFTTWPADADPESMASAGGGYHVCLDHLTRLLDGEPGPALTDPAEQPLTQRWTAAYLDQLTAPA
jgi:uncharacterized protein YndB with AHSA1/START domain